MGVDVGKDEATSPVSKDVKANATEVGEVLDDVHGLCVFPDYERVSFVSSSVSPLIATPSTTFVEEFTKAYELNPKLNDKQSLALEMYNLSHFESSLRAHFLMLATAVECLCFQDAQPDPVVGYVETLIEQAQKSGIEAVQDTSFLSRLGELKTESISKACRRLVEKHLDADAAALFQKCYRIRCDLSHDGKCSEDLGTYTPKLDKLVSQLVLADIENTSGK